MTAIAAPPRARAILEAFVVAATLSGAPSTAWAVCTGGDPLEATRAAGAMFVPPSAGALPLFATAAAVHLAVSALWTLVLVRTLPSRFTYVAAAAWALAIAALDLGVIGRRFPSVAALAVGPQVADHLAFTLLLAAVLRFRGALRGAKGTAS